ncbi:MAG: phage portal protein [Bifidobacteriaceae bacterium]|nr:phage portal protein [Bifidobacteriaceae bacterium]
MSTWTNLKRAASTFRALQTRSDMPAAITPPPRSTSTDPLALSTVFRGIQILQTALTGLPIRQLKNGYQVERVDNRVLHPDVNRSRRDFISDTVASLALDGNAFYRKVVFDGQIVSLEILPPQYVTIVDLAHDPASPRLSFSYLGTDYSATDIIHLKFLNVPGRLRGLGPISAAREEVDGAHLARDYKAQWFTDGSNPKGILSTDKPTNPAIEEEAKRKFKEGAPGDIKVLGHDFHYQPLTLNPKDMQFLETQKFDTTQIARLLGVPASLMLAAVDGSNLTYSNIEQSWIEFSDYTLAAYAGEIEEALTTLLPRGNEVAFDWDSSRRANTTDKYTAYAAAISAQWLTPDEVRMKEGLQPLNQPIKQKEDINGEA